MWTCVSRLWGRYLRMEWMRNHCFNLKCQTVFQNECTTLSYHQQCLIVPFSELPPAMSDCTVLSYHQQCLIVPFSELPPAVSDCTVFWVTTSSVWQVQLFCTFVNTLNTLSVSSAYQNSVYLSRSNSNEHLFLNEFLFHPVLSFVIISSSKTPKCYYLFFFMEDHMI